MLKFAIGAHEVICLQSVSITVTAEVAGMPQATFQKGPRVNSRRCKLSQPVNFLKSLYTRNHRPIVRWSARYVRIRYLSLGTTEAAAYTRGINVVLETFSEKDSPDVGAVRNQSIIATAAQS